MLNEAEPDEMAHYYNMRLIYPMGYLRNLSQCYDCTFLDQLIPSQAQLVLVGQ